MTIGFGEECPVKSAVTKCYREFKFGKQMLEDDNHYSCLVTTFNVENVVKVKLLIKEDPRITHAETQDALGISLGSVNNSHHDHLSVSKC